MLSPEQVREQYTKNLGEAMFGEEKSYDLLEQENKRLKDHRVCKLIDSATKIITEGTWETISEEPSPLMNVAANFLLQQFEEYTKGEVVTPSTTQVSTVTMEEILKMREDFQKATGMKTNHTIMGSNVQLSDGYPDGEDMSPTTKEYADKVKKSVREECQKIKERLQSNKP